MLWVLVMLLKRLLTQGNLFFKFPFTYLNYFSDSSICIDYNYYNNPIDTSINKQYYSVFA